MNDKGWITWTMSRLGIMLCVVTMIALLYGVYKYVGCINASDSANKEAENMATALMKAYAGPVGTTGTYAPPSKIEGHRYTLEIIDSGKKGVLIKIMQTRCGISPGGAPFNAALTAFPRMIKNETEENLTLFFENTPNGLSIGRKSGCQGCIQAEEIDYDTNCSKEYITLNNSCQTRYELSGWKMTNGQGEEYVFPKQILEPGQSIRIYTCAGSLRWCSQPCQTKWAYADTVYLTDATDSTCLQYKYK